MAYGVENPLHPFRRQGRIREFSRAALLFDLFAEKVVTVEAEYPSHCPGIMGLEGDLVVS